MLTEAYVSKPKKEKYQHGCMFKGIYIDAFHQHIVGYFVIVDNDLLLKRCHGHHYIFFVNEHLDILGRESFTRSSELKSKIEMYYVAVTLEDFKKYFQNETQEQYTPATTEQFNEVTKPKHYMLLPDKNVEVRDVVHAVVNRMSNNGYSAMQCSDYAQSLQYVLRFDEKGGVKDLEKAKWYLDKIIAAETTKGN